MTGKWHKVRLSEYIVFLHGFAFKGEFFNEDFRGDILVTPGNFNIGGGFKDSKFKYYDGPEAAGFFLGEGDLVVSMTDLSKAGDTLGAPAIIPKQKDGKRFLHNQRIGKASILNESIDDDFLYFLLRGEEFHRHVLASATGSTVRHTSPGRMGEYIFSIPPLPIQRQIASILSAFDDKIELNRQMNRTLEQMARALFKSWFVDFDPVRAKMRGEQPAGMDAETAALFPDRLVEVEGKEVPEGWELRTIGDLAIQTKEQINPADQPEAMFAHFSIPAFDANNQPALELGIEIKSNKFIVPNGVILVSKLNPSIPRIWDTDAIEDADLSVCSTEFIPLLPRHPVFYPFLLLTLKSETFSKSLADQASGTSNSHQRVKPADILNAPAVSPIGSVIAAFGGLTISILESMKYSLRESAQLVSTRDALLPRLLAGEVDLQMWEDN